MTGSVIGGSVTSDKVGDACVVDEAVVELERASVSDVFFFPPQAETDNTKTSRRRANRIFFMVFPFYKNGFSKKQTGLVALFDGGVSVGNHAEATLDFLRVLAVVVDNGEGSEQETDRGSEKERGNGKSSAEDPEEELDGD